MTRAQRIEAALVDLLSELPNKESPTRNRVSRDTIDEAQEALESQPAYRDARGLELHARLTAAGSFPQMSASEGHELSEWIDKLLEEARPR